jgi:hypothetical protein
MTRVQLHCWPHIMRCVNTVLLIKHLIVLMISCLKVNEWKLIHSYGQEVIFSTYSFIKGTAVAQWLRYCATNRKVAGLIPDGVIGIFH